MKRRLFVVLIAIISVAILGLIGYTILSLAYQFNSALKPIENADSIYSDAISRVDCSQDYTLQVSSTKEITVNGSSFLETSSQTVQYDVLSPDESRIHLQETITSGSHIFQISELFANGVVYLNINETPFMSDCSAEQYADTLTPAIILTPQLYNNISGVDNHSGYTITFSNPTGIENWLEKDTVTFIEGNGTATVGYDGRLQDSTYAVSYQQNNITFRITVKVSIITESVDVQIPTDTEKYTPINHWQGPETLERATGYLIQSQSISSKYNDSIYMQAMGDRRTQNVSLHAYYNDAWSMYMNTAVGLENDAKQDQIITNTKLEIFRDNIYSVSNNGEPFSSNEGISADTVYNYFQDHLVSTILLPQDIASSEITETDSSLLIQFNGTETFANFLTNNVCRILYNNEALLSDTGAKITVKTLACYIEIDRLTGLPIASGIDFSGSYSSLGVPYLVEYCAEQFYDIPSNTAQAEIAKAAGQ